MTHDPPTEDAVRAAYRRLPRRSVYDVLLTLGWLGGRSPIRRRLVRTLGLGAGDRVLDIGCGTGLGLYALESEVGPTAEIVGIDGSDAMLAHAATRVERGRWSNVDLIFGDGRALPLVDASFQGVCSMLALSGIPGWQRALGEVQRVLAPGGRIALLEAAPIEGVWKHAAPVLREFQRRVFAWRPPEPPVDDVLRDRFDEVTVEAAAGGLWAIITARAPR